MDKTKLMFTNFIDWRRENDVDNVIEVRSFVKEISRKLIKVQLFLIAESDQELIVYQLNSNLTQIIISYIRHSHS